MKRLATIALLLSGHCWGADVILGVGNPTSWGGSGTDRYAVWSTGASANWPTKDPDYTHWIRAYAMPWQTDTNQVVDYSANAHNLTLGASTARPTFSAASGTNGAYWSFDGGDYAWSTNTGALSSLAITQGTICGWAYTVTDSGALACFLTTSDTNSAAISYMNWGVDLTGSFNKPNFFSYDGSSYTSHVRPSGSYGDVTGIWYFWAVSFSGSNATNFHVYAYTTQYGWKSYDADGYDTRTGTAFLKYGIFDATYKHDILTMGALRYSSSLTLYGAHIGRQQRLVIYDFALSEAQLQLVASNTIPTNVTEGAP